MAHLRETRYGQADSCRFYCCPDGHLHIVGFGADNVPEYEIVLGRRLMDICQNALEIAQGNLPENVVEIRGKG